MTIIEVAYHLFENKRNRSSILCYLKIVWKLIGKCVYAYDKKFCAVQWGKEKNT